MKIIRNKYIPFPGYKAINLFGVLFVKNNAKIDDVTINHESIHSRQFVELMVLFAVATVFIRWWMPLLSPLFFYLWYLVEWIVRLFQHRDTNEAYKNISFEREAYVHEGTTGYLEDRPIFNWRRFL